MKQIVIIGVILAVLTWGAGAIGHTVAYHRTAPPQPYTTGASWLLDYTFAGDDSGIQPAVAQIIRAQTGLAATVEGAFIRVEGAYDTVLTMADSTFEFRAQSGRFIPVTSLPQPPRRLMTPDTRPAAASNAQLKIRLFCGGISVVILLVLLDRWNQARLKRQGEPVELEETESVF